MAKFIGWAVIIIFGIVVIGIILEDEVESSSTELSSSETDALTTPIEAPKKDAELVRTEIQYVSSSSRGIVACPTSTGIERFINVAIDDTKDDADRTRVVDHNVCSVVGERDVITLLAEKKADGSLPLAGQYTYEIAGSEFAIILVDIEKGENRVPSARDIEDGRYWVITSIVLENSWEESEVPLPETPKSVSELEESNDMESDPKLVFRVTIPDLLPYCPTASNLQAVIHTDRESRQIVMKQFNCRYFSNGDKFTMYPEADSFSYLSERTYLGGEDGDAINITKVKISDRFGNILYGYTVTTAAIMLRYVDLD